MGDIPSVAQVMKEQAETITRTERARTAALDLAVDIEKAMIDNGQQPRRPQELVVEARVFERYLLGGEDR